MTQHTKPVDVTAFGDAIVQWLAYNSSQPHVQLRIYPVRKYGSTRRMDRNKGWLATTEWAPSAQMRQDPQGQTFGHSLSLIEHLLDEDSPVIMKLDPGTCYGVEGRSPDGMTIIASCYMDVPGDEEVREGSSSNHKTKQQPDDDSFEGVMKLALRKKMLKVVERAVGDDDDDGTVVSGARVKPGALIPVGDGTFMTPEQFQLTMNQRERRLEEKDTDVQRLNEQLAELRDKLEDDKNSTGKMVRETIDKTIKLGFIYLQSRMQAKEEEKEEARKGKGRGRGRGGRKGPSRREMELMLQAMQEEDGEEYEGEEEDEDLPAAPRRRGAKGPVHPWATNPGMVSGSSMPPPPHVDTVPVTPPFHAGFRAASGPPTAASPYSTMLDDSLAESDYGPPDMEHTPPEPGAYPNLFGGGGVSGPPILPGTREPVRPVAMRSTSGKRGSAATRGEERSSIERLEPVAADIVSYVMGLMDEVSFLDLEDTAKEHFDRLFVDRCRAHGIGDTEILLFTSNADRLADLLICAMTEEQKEELGDFVVDRIRQVILEKASSTNWNALLR